MGRIWWRDRSADVCVVVVAIMRNMLDDDEDEDDVINRKGEES